MFKAVSKLKNCKKKLLKWRCNKLKNPKILIGELNDKLRDIQKAPPSKENLELEEKMVMELESIQIREEFFWKQRYRIRWLQVGDRNSHFFYVSVSQRKQRNNIIRLKDGANWVVGEEELVELAVKHFTMLFSKLNHSSFGHVLDAFPH